jgi:ABC-type microcin C transport system permease subunit YejB
VGTTGWVATLTFLLAVPVSIWLSFQGHYLGIYSYGFVPIAFGIIVAVLFGVLLVVVFPKLNERGW